MEDPDEDEDFGESPELRAEEEDLPTATMAIGDDFRDYESIKIPNGVTLRQTPPQRPPRGTFGILDLPDARLTTPPCFTEPETLEAMTRLGYTPEDLTQVSTASFSAQNSTLRDKVLLELDRRRMQMISNVIAERNRIVSGDPPPEKRRKKGRAKRTKAAVKKRTPISPEESNSERGRTDRERKARRLDAIGQRLKAAEARAREMVDKQREKANEKTHMRAARMRQHREAVAKAMRERARNQQEDLLNADKIQQRIQKTIAKKRQALRRKEKERNERARAARREVESMRGKTKGKKPAKNDG
jgi:hypothetical protein